LFGHNNNRKDTFIYSDFGRFAPIENPEMSLKPFLTLLFVQLSLLSVLATRNVSVSGYVFDSHNKAIELVRISEFNGKHLVYTNSNGSFNLTIDTEDTLRLRFSCLSYVPVVQIIPVLSDKLILNVILMSSEQALKEVTIQGNQNADATFNSLDASKIRLLPDPSGGSIEALLVTYAGVSSNNEMSSQYSVRGGNYDENLVYVNGTEIYRPLLIRAGQQEGMSFVNPEMVREVNFSAGGFDARYGDKMSSVLDITYKKPSRFESVANMSLLGANAYVGHASKDGRFTQIHGFRYKTNQYLLGTLDTKASYNPSFIDYQTYLSWQLNPTLELGFLGNFSSNNYNFIPESSETVFGTFNQKFTMSIDFEGQEKDKFQTLFGSLSIHKKMSDTFDFGLQTSVFRTVENEHYDITGSYWLSQTPIENNEEDPSKSNMLGDGLYHEHARKNLDASVFNISQTASWDRGNNHWQSGISFQLEQINDKIREWEMRDSAGYSLPYTSTGPGIIYSMHSDVEMNSGRLQAFLMDRWRFRTEAGLFALTAGIRTNYWSFNNDWIVSPRATLTFRPVSKNDLAFRLSGGVYYQAPFYKELRDTFTVNGLTRVVLNKNIRSQKTIQVVSGLDYKFEHNNRPFKLTTELYYKSMSDLIPYTVDNVRIRYSGKNQASGYTAGFDAKLFGELVPGSDSWLSLSLMRSRETMGGVTIPRPNESRYNVSFYFQDYFPNQPKITLNLKIIVADGLPFGPPDKGRSYATLRLPPYRRIDIGLSRLLVGGEDKILRSSAFRFVRKVWLGVDCFNLFGIRNTNSYYWLSDISNNQWAVPNYLTNRLLNLRISTELR
jgi:hypothetical protein